MGATLMAIAQLPLAVQLPDDETFATFVAGDNQETLDLVQGHEQGLMYIWGAKGVGKSHLLHALCADTDEALMYVALNELYQDVQAQVLQGLEQYSLLCLDNIDAVTHDQEWCYELFSLLNRIRDRANGRIVVTSNVAPLALNVAIPDVHSRLQWGLTLHLKSLRDEDKARALQIRAKALGLILRDDTAQFMVQRLGRDMNGLMACLSRLDRASIAAKRRLTIPFVKDVLEI